VGSGGDKNEGKKQRGRRQMSAAEVQRKMGNGFHFIVSEFQHKIVPATCGNLRGRKR